MPLVALIFGFFNSKSKLSQQLASYDIII